LVAIAIDVVVGSLALLTYSAPATQVARILATMPDTIGKEEPPLREKVSVVLVDLPLCHADGSKISNCTLGLWKFSYSQTLAEAGPLCDGGAQEEW